MSDEPVIVRYDEPHRKYHTRTHLDECRALLEELQDLDNDSSLRDLVILNHAINYHDAIYDPKAQFKRNEIASAALAFAELRSLLYDDRLEVMRLILLTAGHEAQTGDHLGKLIISLDLGILGSAPGRYDEYAAQIAEEYEAVFPTFQYRIGRRKFLTEMLNRPVIFPTPYFHDKFDSQARANMARELAHLWQEGLEQDGPDAIPPQWL